MKQKELVQILVSTPFRSIPLSSDELCAGATVTTRRCGGADAREHRGRLSAPMSARLRRAARSGKAIGSRALGERLASLVSPRLA